MKPSHFKKSRICFVPLWFVLLALCAGVQLHAQQGDTNSIASIKAKAEKGDAAAQFALGYTYENGTGVATNLTEAFKWYSKAAEQTNAEAEFHLGLCYFTGKGLPTAKMSDFSKEDIASMKSQGIDPTTVINITQPTIAVQWFRKAALQNYAPAQYNLGNCYYFGTGVRQDSVKAVKWYRQAAEQGLPIAEFNLATVYSHGDGVTTNYSEAVKWYQMSANQGYAPAQNMLGIWYEQGFSVNQDYVEAAKWYSKAADQGDVDAQEAFAELLFNGKGVTRNYVEAVKWHRRAAYQGNAVAQYNLGNQYYRGFGVIRDYVKADKWFNLASAQGLDPARKYLSVVEQSMTPEQIAEAQQSAREFVPRKENFNSNDFVSSENPIASGSGFFITDDGYLISNYHVVKDTTKVRLLTGAGLIDAKVVQVDAANDLALLKADGKFSPLPISSSRSAQLGGTVATVGFPDIGLQGFAPKLAKGEIASLSGAVDDPRYFQISAPVQPGNSGGALVDERGNVIGIVSAKLNASAALAASGALPENVNYAVKSSLLLSFLESVPDVDAKLKAPNTKDEKFEDVVKSAQDAAVLVLVY